MRWLMLSIQGSLVYYVTGWGEGGKRRGVGGGGEGGGEVVPESSMGRSTELLHALNAREI